jgi:signal transduction histidine kinase
MASESGTEPRLARSRSELALDVGIALAAFAASLVQLAADDDGGGVDSAGVLLTGLATLPLVARRRWPLPVFVLTALASTALRGVATPPGPPIGPTVAVFSLALSGHGSRARQRGTLAVVAVMLAVHAAAHGLAEDRFPGAQLVFGLLLWGGTWFAGDRARLRAERMAELEDRAVRAEREAERERRLAAAEERTRIARDLHDSAGHAINVILVHAGAGRLAAERDPAAARAAFATIEEVARETLGDIDELVGVLRTGPEDGDAVEPPPGVAAVEGLVERHRSAGLDVELAIRGERAPLPTGVDRGAYRILQEALTNAARHGDGRASVAVEFGDDALALTVANPVGAGARAAGEGGHGIVGMRERAALLGGTLEAGSRNGRFEVRATLPVTGRA